MQSRAHALPATLVQQLDNLSVEQQWHHASFVLLELHAQATARNQVCMALASSLLFVPTSRESRVVLYALLLSVAAAHGERGAIDTCCVQLRVRATPATLVQQRGNRSVQRLWHLATSALRAPTAWAMARSLRHASSARFRRAATVRLARQPCQVRRALQVHTVLAARRPP